MLLNEDRMRIVADSGVEHTCLRPKRRVSSEMTDRMRMVADSGVEHTGLLLLKSRVSSEMTGWYPRTALCARVKRVQVSVSFGITKVQKASGTSVLVHSADTEYWTETISWRRRALTIFLRLSFVYLELYSCAAFFHCRVS